MEALQIIFALTALTEAGLGIALLYRLQNPQPDSSQYPHFVVRSKKFYRSRQGTDGTWEIR